MSFKHHKQMSESFLTAAFLSVSGGLQDAYTYIFREKSLPMPKQAILSC